MKKSISKQSALTCIILPETSQRVRTGKLFKSILFVFMLSFMTTMLTSCFWGHHGHYRHGEGFEHHDDHR